MQITKMTSNIGAVIEGVDLGQTLSASQEDMIYEALIDNSVIFFRDQNIAPEQHLAFARSFGEIDKPHPVYQHVPGFDNIVMLANDANNPPDTDGWHTDLTFRQDPPFASILVARDVPAYGGDTMWASMCAAYDALPATLQTYFSDLKAVHDMGDFRNNFTIGEDKGDKLNAGMQRFGSAIHPIVKTHPVSGRKFLYVNEGFTSHIIGMTARESRRWLNFLLDHINRPEYQVRFLWQAGSVAMWDNRSTQHYAVADYMPAYRCMNRITVVKDRRTNS